MSGSLRGRAMAIKKKGHMKRYQKDDLGKGMFKDTKYIGQVKT